MTTIPPPGTSSNGQAGHDPRHLPGDRLHRDLYRPATNLSGERTLYNTNALLTSALHPGYTYSGTIGIKTGKAPARRATASPPPWR